MHNSLKANELDALFKRRLHYVYTELCCSDAKYDQTMSILLRALSNVATVGSDGTSFAVKCKNPRLSVEARNLRLVLNDDKKWASLTINEHPMPLKYLWKKWLSVKKNLSEELIWLDLVAHPMITITKEEDARLREIDKSYKKITPDQRYALAKITLIDSR